MRTFRIASAFAVALAALALPARADDEAPPAPFMWGFSSSSYQYEDPGAFKTDWDLAAERHGQPSPRGGGVYSWSHFEKDVEALRRVGATHFRFSVEWARVEPRPGVYDAGAIQKYVEHARMLRAAGIVPVVCLWHFTFPSWASDLDKGDKHGWLNPTLQRRWGPYVAKMAAAFGPLVDLYAPQNEPNNVARGEFLLGAFPPNLRLHDELYNRAVDRSADLFIEAARVIRAANPRARILSIQNVFSWEETSAFMQGYIDNYNYRHLDRIAGSLDYLGFNYFTREPTDPLTYALNLMSRGRDGFSDLGWVIDPPGLKKMGRLLYERYQLPLIVTENGVADAKDTMREDFVLAHLENLKDLERQGVPVLGYFHWSLADNYEWLVGFDAKFGIFALDQDAMRLVPKPSENFYEELIKAGWGAIRPR